MIDGYVEGAKTSNINFNLNHLLKKNNSDDFWFYLGSSTIPLCSNGRLNWIVSKKIFKMT